MFKKIISGISVLSILLSCIINSLLFAYAQPESATLPKGAEVVWNFDKCEAVSSSDSEWVTKDPSLMSRVTVETNTDNVYGKAGKSLKFDYVDRMRVWRNKTTNVTGESLVVWVKSDKATKLEVLGLFNGWSNTGSYTLDVKQGENILIYNFKDFNYQQSLSGEVTIINQLQFITNGTGVLWIDSIGFYTEGMQGDSEVEFPEGTTTKWNFDDCNEISDTDTEWTTKEAAISAQLTLETNPENVYGESGKSLKWSHTDSKRLWTGNKEIPVSGDGVIMWIKSSKNTKLTLYGYINGWSMVGSLTMDIKIGDNIVYFKYSNMTYKKAANMSVTDAPAKVSKFIQMQLVSSGTGTIWIDNIGFYTEPLPTDPEYNVPTEVSKHSLDFLESGLKETAWSNTYTENADFRVVSAAAKYHSGTTNAGDNTSAVRVSYKNLSASGNVQLVYNEKISVLRLSEQLDFKDSVLSFWVWSSQSVKFKIESTKEKIHDIPAGESIVKIPLGDIVIEDDATDYSSISKLSITVIAEDNAQSEGLIYLDAVGFYNSGYEINSEMQYLPQDSVIWWDFDQYTTTDDIAGVWNKHWSGTEDKGVSLSMEEDDKSVYAGMGRSLKIEYDRTNAEWNGPGIWHSSLMTTYGKGFAFWIKSNEKTTFNLICLDAKYRNVCVNGIEVEIGENIVLVDYEDFEFTKPIEGETPQMDKVSQWQIRMSGCNNGTIWFDSFAFYGISEDGPNTSKFFNPPDSYNTFEEGVQSTGDDFEAWPGDDDLDFCTDWFYADAGWITLNKMGDDNTVLRMDYDMSKKSSVLNNITVFEGVDPNGGISFWAKCSEERNFSVTVVLGNSTIKTVIKGSTEGRYYKIPFSEFWHDSNIAFSYEAASKDLVKVTRLIFSTDDSVNPPSVNASPVCTLWLDNITFVDSLAYKRAGAVNYYENGVRMIAGEDAFSSGIDPMFTLIDLDESQKNEYLSQMKGASRFVKLVSLKAYNMNGVAAVPNRSVELIFDVAEDESAENAAVYQVYLDGSVMKTATTVGLDGKLHATVYRLGDYAVVYQSNTVVDDFSDNKDDYADNKDDYSDNENDYPDNEADYSDNENNYPDNEENYSDDENDSSDDEVIDIPLTGDTNKRYIAFIALMASLFVLSVLTFKIADWRGQNETEYRQ